VQPGVKSSIALHFHLHTNASGYTTLSECVLEGNFHRKTGAMHRQDVRGSWLQLVREEVDSWWDSRDEFGSAEVKASHDHVDWSVELLDGVTDDVDDSSMRTAGCHFESASSTSKIIQVLTPRR
jgi:hypothetical protein